jgi:hypothetical protein
MENILKEAKKPEDKDKKDDEKDKDKKWSRSGSKLYQLYQL